MEEESVEVGRTLILKDGAGNLQQIKHLLELEQAGKDREWEKFIMPFFSKYLSDFLLPGPHLSLLLFTG